MYLNTPDLSFHNFLHIKNPEVLLYSQANGYLKEQASEKEPVSGVEYDTLGKKERLALLQSLLALHCQDSSISDSGSSICRQKPSQETRIEKYFGG